MLGQAETTIERVDIDLPGCQGLCFAFGALYAVVNHGKPGLHRLTDRDGDGALDHAELLRALDGDGEHGPHAVEIAPDGEHLLVLCGNHVLPPELSRSRVTRPFVEDVLVPGINDPNGHAVGIKAPGGYVCRVDKDGKEWEMLCCGFRNAYDLTVLPSGDDSLAKGASAPTHARATTRCAAIPTTRRYRSTTARRARAPGPRCPRNGTTRSAR